MSQSVISVENLSKAYRIGVKEEVPDTLMGALKNVLSAPWRNFNQLRRLNTTAAKLVTESVSGNSSSPPRQCSNPRHPAADTLWALRDVCFEVDEGDVVGIIGRNGAGKSTLLKVLSRITEPTSGRAIIRGRVSSLLEVGTGFHPELSGRDNIYMNGTILGMTKREIDRKFDEIVDFSGVQQFLDTPTKHYSSGMQVRLAFAVAAHLDPEILIVDEVLAVGDAGFQSKCMRKMKEASQSGRTVLLVSHNMAAIENLCTSAIGFKDGEIIAAGSVDTVIRKYLAEVSNPVNTFGQIPTANAVIQSVSVADLETGFEGVVRSGSTVTVKMRYSSPALLPQARVGFRIDSLSGARLILLQSEISTGNLIDLPSGGELSCSIDRFPLPPGVYSIAIALFSNGVIVDSGEQVCEFRVDSGDFYKTGRLPAESLCSFLVPSNWKFGD